MKIYSQCGQDEYIYNTFFKDKTNGFYVDIGANNGVTGSNTKLFEDLGWSGVCVEPNPDTFKYLLQNRTCKCVEGAVSNLEKELVEFCKIDGYAEMLSGIIDTYDESHKLRIVNEQKLYGGKREKVLVKNFKFDDIIENINIDYLSIDTEGSELNILQSINFKKYNINIISAENNYGKRDVYDFMIKQGFKYISNKGPDEIYQNENNI